MKIKMDSTKTLFLDIDGTLIYHYGIPNKQTKLHPIMLPGVEEKLIKWEAEGHKIILMTGRRESERDITIKQLSDLGIVYDMLIMGINPGKRIIINDLKPESDEPTALAFCVKRNEGLKNIEI